MSPVSSSQSAIIERLQALAAAGPAHYFRWADHAIPDAESFRLASATLWMMEHQIQWQMIYDRHKWFFRTKRIFDIVLALACLPLLVVITIVVGILQKALHPNQPIFFYQLRTGQNTRPFWMIKFRTANPHAPRVNHFIGSTQGFAPQPLPWLSRILRRFSLDELPQIINVLKGDMSFVGPRPLSANDTLFVNENLYQRFSAPPGLTGLWQSKIPIVTRGFEKLHYDCEYIQHLGWRQDLEILFNTLKVICYKPFAQELWGRTATVSESK